MNRVAKIILRVLAVAVGTYYAYGGLYLFQNRSDMSAAGMVGYFGAILGQVVVGTIFVGIGLGLWRIALNAKAR
jgi:hypothetical protein